MDPSNVNSRELQQQAIDADIKSLEKSIHTLKHRRNAFAHISSLPTEIITAIFFLLRVPGTGGKPDTLLALRITHVCHRWREIALNQPLFWSHVNFTTVSPTGATEILARARTAPLHLEAKVPIHIWDSSRFLSFKKDLQAHVSHIYHLRISAAPAHLQKTLQGLISPAPTLEHLSLSIEKYRPRTSSRISVPDTLFDATTPRLSSLELSNCNISWKSPLLSGLKNLEIITLSVSARPTLTDWLDALDGMPQLESLILDSAFPVASRFPVDVQRTVTLPFLAHLDISAAELDCGLALAHLVLPALTSLGVTARSDHPIVGEVQKILPYVAQHAHGPQDAQPLQSVFSSSSRTHLEIVAWPTPDIDVTVWDANPSPRVVLSVRSKDWNLPDDHITILGAALTVLPLDNLVMLTPPYDLRLDEHFWHHHAPRWPLLERLHLGISPARGFREMLLQDNGGRECPLLPSLTNIEMVENGLSARRTLRLCDALMKRVEQGVPLEVLDLRSCFGTSFAVRLLSEIVADVLDPTEIIGTEGPTRLVWDGARGPFFPDNDSEDDHLTYREGLYTTDDDEEGDA
ncbi:hypothetical protein EI94DRAFT_1743698 [Lactarius quietus]|nr:hypothetical protein EI94DRAFT_1743698 [Lactarius quietus]